MYYQKIFAIKALQEYIRYFWVLEDHHTDRTKETSFKIIPDGLPGLIFQQESSLFIDQDNHVMPRLFVYGQTTGHAIHRTTEPFENMGVYLLRSCLTPNPSLISEVA